LDYPSNWQIVHENVQAGEWQVAVGIAGPQTSSGRAGIMVNAKQGPVTADGGGGWMKVSVIGGGGQLSNLPKTPQEFIEKTKREAGRSFSGFQFETSNELRLAEGSAVRLLYSYNGNSGRIKEMNITRFGTFSTFQFTCEAPPNDWPSVEPVFNRIIESFKLT
jgi:hypothetical protein